MNAHSLLIIRNGKIIDETYFFPYQKDDMINIHSCTKSIISALVGIAIEEGYSLFSEYVNCMTCYA